MFPICKSDTDNAIVGPDDLALESPVWRHPQSHWLLGDDGLGDAYLRSALRQVRYAACEPICADLHLAPPGHLVTMVFPAIRISRWGSLLFWSRSHGFISQRFEKENSQC